MVPTIAKITADLVTTTDPSVRAAFLMQQHWAGGVRPMAHTHHERTVLDAAPLTHVNAIRRLVVNVIQNHHR